MSRGNGRIETVGRYVEEVGEDVKRLVGRWWGVGVSWEAAGLFPASEAVVVVPWWEALTEGFCITVYAHVRKEGALYPEARPMFVLGVRGGRKRAWRVAAVIAEALGG